MGIWEDELTSDVELDPKIPTLLPPLMIRHMFLHRTFQIFRIVQSLLANTGNIRIVGVESDRVRDRQEGELTTHRAITETILQVVPPIILSEDVFSEMHSAILFQLVLCIGQRVEIFLKI